MARQITVAYGINGHGTIVGLYVDAGGFQHGFLDNGGVFSTQDIPGSINSGVYGINNLGDTVGYYVDAAGAHGYSKSGTTVTTLNFPGTNRTYARGINDSGEIVGYFNFNLPSANFDHGLVDIGGLFQQVDLPGAMQTEIFGVNDLGQIVGSYVTGAGVMNGFLGTPVAAPEPWTLAVLFPYVTGFLLYRRRR